MCVVTCSNSVYCCSFCGPGRVANAAATGCDMCAGNTYKPYFNSSACSSCPPRFFASPNHDTCWTIVYAAPPALLVSRKVFAISGLNLQNMSGAPDTSLGAFSIQVSVVKVGGNANSSGSIIASGWANYSLGSWSYSSIAPSLGCLLYTSPSPRDRTRSRMPSSA